MGRLAKYEWDKILPEEGDRWCFPYEDRHLVRASLAQWAKRRGKKFKTRRINHTSVSSGDHSFMLEVTRLES